MRIVVLAGLLMTGCVDETVEPGLLGPLGGIVNAPVSATVDSPFVVHISTFGGGCIRFERTDVELHVDGADIWPMDRFTHEDACTQILNHYVHDVTLTFHDFGTKTIVVHGSQESTGGGRLEDYRVELVVVVDCPTATCAS